MSFARVVLRPKLLDIRIGLRESWSCGSNSTIRSRRYISMYLPTPARATFVSVVLVSFFVSASLPVAAQRTVRTRSTAITQIAEGPGAGSGGVGGGVAVPAGPQEATRAVIMPPQAAPRQPSAGLIINGTFDSSITSDPNALA